MSLLFVNCINSDNNRSERLTLQILFIPVLCLFPLTSENRPFLPLVICIYAVQASINGAQLLHILCSTGLS